MGPALFAAEHDPLSYPPRLVAGVSLVTDSSPQFLKPGANLRAGVAIAGVPPAVDFMFYPNQDHPGNPWSVWGNGSVAGMKYYSAIGDHLGPKGTAKVFEYDASAKTIRQLVDVHAFLDSVHAIPPNMDYSPGKIHSRIQMGGDGWLYYATHRGLEPAADDKHGYRGDWILRTHPPSGMTEMCSA